MTETVTVALKHPSGLMLRVFDIEEGTEPVMGGGSRPVKIATQRGEMIKINGTPVNGDTHLNGGFALTHNVPKDFWDLWLKQNEGAEIIKQGLIFSYAAPAKAGDAATERAELKSGLERLDPENLPKVGRHKIETAKAA